MELSAQAAIIEYHRLGVFLLTWSLSSKRDFFISSQFWRLVPKSRCQEKWSLVRSLSLPYRWHLLTVPAHDHFSVHAEGGRTLASLPLLIRTPGLLDQVLTLMILFTLITSLKAPSPNTIPLGVRARHMTLEETHSSL